MGSWPMGLHFLIHSDIPAGNLPITYAVKIPVLFLRGIADSASPEVGVHSIKVISYEGAGHWLMYQEKDRVVKDVLAWLSESSLTAKL